MARPNVADSPSKQHKSEEIATAASPNAKLWSPTFALLMGIQFSHGTAFSTFFTLPKFLIEERTATATLVGNAHGVFAFAGASMALVLGPLLDRYGRRPILMFGLALGCLTYAPFGYVESPALILVLRALHGLSFAAVFNAGAALAVDLAPISRRGEAIGYFGTAMLVTNAVGPALAEPMAASYSWKAVFIGCSFCTAIALALALRLKAPPRSSPQLRNVPAPVKRCRVPLYGAYFGSLAVGVGVGASKTFLPALLVSANLGVAAYFLLYTAGAVVQRTLFGWLPDRLGNHWTFRGRALRRLPSTVLALLAYAVALGAAATVGTPHIYWLAPIIGFAHGLAYPAVSALAIDLADPNQHGRTTAWLTGLFNLGWGLSTAGLAPFQIWLGYEGLLLSAAAFVLIISATIPALVLRRIGV